MSKRAAASTAQQITQPAEVEDDEVVRRRVASGELVPLPRWGEPPVRDHVVAEMRAKLAQPARPRPAPKR